MNVSIESFASMIRVSERGDFDGLRRTRLSEVRAFWIIGSCESNARSTRTRFA
jgi:hypothetical protein